MGHTVTEKLGFLIPLSVPVLEGVFRKTFLLNEF